MPDDQTAEADIESELHSSEPLQKARSELPQSAPTRSDSDDLAWQHRFLEQQSDHYKKRTS